MRRFVLVSLALITACGGETSSPTPQGRCPPAAAGATQLYDPAHGDKVELWPDPLLTVEDATSPTGMRIDTTADKAAWVGFISPLLRDVFVQASVASGFARNGGVVFRFSEPVEGLPTTVAESLDSEALMLLDLERGERVPFEVELSSDGRIVILQPVVTLEPNSLHLAAVGATVSSQGACVASSEVMATLLSGEASDELSAVAPAYADALAQAGLGADELVAATVFRTHADHLRVVAAADHASAASHDWSSAPSCEAGPGLRHCEAMALISDYRDEAGVVLSEPQASYDLPVSIALPSGPGPHPVVMFGHGLGGQRSQVGAADAMAEELGFITVATDALRHGEHPTATGGGATDFLGINLGDGPAPPLDTLALKSNFNQTSLDRLQVLKLLREHPDIDGDGQPDVDVDHIGYWGISLGGLLGPGLSSLSDDVAMAILSVGGGKLTNFVRDSTEVEQLLGLLAGLLGGPDEFNALLAVLQTMVDGGDPAMWGAHVLRDRLRGGPPHLLLPLAMSDGVVPPSTGKALARALGLPQMSPVVEEVPPLTTVAGPLAGNDGGITVGYFQFDRVGDPPSPATHNLPGSAEAMTQARHFLETWIAGLPEIIDPYPWVGTPPL